MPLPAGGQPDFPLQRAFPAPSLFLYPHSFFFFDTEQELILSYLSPIVCLCALE
jgi:hypothetical protein